MTSPELGKMIVGWRSWKSFSTRHGPPRTTRKAPGFL